MIAGGTSARGDVDHPQPRLAQQQQEEEEPLLVGLHPRAGRAGSGVIDGTTTTDSPGWLSRIALQTPGEPLLQAREARLALVLAEVGERARGREPLMRRSGPRSARSRCSARIGRENPRRAAPPTGSATRISWAAACTRWLTRIWPGAASRAEPAGEVRDGADGGVVEAPLEADRAERGVALRDPDAEVELVALPAPALGQLGDAVAHRHRHPHGPLRRVGTGQRIVEEHHDPVAGEALERPLVAVHEVAERPRGTRAARPSRPRARPSRRTR